MVVNPLQTRCATQCHIEVGQIRQYVRFTGGSGHIARDECDVNQGVRSRGVAWRYPMDLRGSGGRGRNLFKAFTVATQRISRDQ